MKVLILLVLIDIPGELVDNQYVSPSTLQALGFPKAITPMYCFISCKVLHYIYNFVYVTLLCGENLFCYL